MDEPPHLFHLTQLFCLTNAHFCPTRQHKHTEPRARMLIVRRPAWAGSSSSPYLQTFLPQMPFIMQILNGIRLIYQAWCKNPSAGNIINNALSKAFFLYMREPGNVCVLKDKNPEWAWPSSHFYRMTLILLQFINTQKHLIITVITLHCIN